MRNLPSPFWFKSPFSYRPRGEPPVPFEEGSRLLMEDGFLLLLEDGASAILLEGNM